MLYLPRIIYKKKLVEISTQKLNSRKNVNINMEINPNTQKKINSKHNKKKNKIERKSHAHMKVNKKFDIKNKIH